MDAFVAGAPDKTEAVDLRSAAAASSNVDKVDKREYLQRMSIRHACIPLTRKRADEGNTAAKRRLCDPLCVGVLRIERHTKEL